MDNNRPESPIVGDSESLEYIWIWQEKLKEKKDSSAYKKPERIRILG